MRKVAIFKECCCGTRFKTYECVSIVSRGRGIFCSKACMYLNRKRRFGFKRVDKGIVSSWFKPGHKMRLGMPGPNFKEIGFGYDALHEWVHRHKGKPAKCERCSSEKNVVWANKSWEYKRDLDDWLQLCCKCHNAYDRAGGWGLAIAKFPELLRKRKSA